MTNAQFLSIRYRKIGPDSPNICEMKKGDLLILKRQCNVRVENYKKLALNKKSIFSECNTQRDRVNICGNQLSFFDGETKQKTTQQCTLIKSVHCGSTAVNPEAQI